MKVGVAGHQTRDSIDWIWVKTCVRNILEKIDSLEGYSSLAVGSDQLFAETVLELGGVHCAVTPFKNYRECFNQASLSKYDKLISRSLEIRLDLNCSSQLAFLEAGKWIVRTVDIMTIIWDGKPAKGKGGTADIYDYTNDMNVPYWHIDPIRKIVSPS